MLRKYHGATFAGSGVAIKILSYMRVFIVLLNV